MNAQQHFWDLFYAWCLGLGFVVLLVIIGFIWNMAYEERIGNPFAPFIRAWESHQKHRQEIAKMKLRTELVKKGMDPDYVSLHGEGNPAGN